MLHPDQFEVGVSDVRRLLQTQFPEFASLPISRLDSWGTVNAVFRVGDELLARLPFVLWGSSDIELEARWLPELAPLLPLSIPEVVGLGRPDDGYPCSWSILRWLPGRELGADDHVPDIGRRLGRFVTALRSVPTVAASVGSRSGVLAPLDGDVRECLSQCVNLVDVQRLTALWEESLDAAPWPGDAVWTHGDLLPGNILVRDDGIAAVIDWAAAGIGDPACDLMAAWSVVPRNQVSAFREAAGLDDAAWIRGRGWALSQAIIALPYYLETNPRMAAQSRRILDRLTAS